MIEWLRRFVWDESWRLSLDSVDCQWVGQTRNQSSITLTLKIFPLEMMSSTDMSDPDPKKRPLLPDMHGIYRFIEPSLSDSECIKKDRHLDPTPAPCQTTFKENMHNADMCSFLPLHEPQKQRQVFSSKPEPASSRGTCIIWLMWLIYADMTPHDPQNLPEPAPFVAVASSKSAPPKPATQRPTHCCGNPSQPGLLKR